MQPINTQSFTAVRPLAWHCSASRRAALSARQGGAVSVSQLPMVRTLARRAGSLATPKGTCARKYGSTVVSAADLPAPLE